LKLFPHTRVQKLDRQNEACNPHYYQLPQRYTENTKKRAVNKWDGQVLRAKEEFPNQKSINMPAKLGKEKKL